MPCEDCLILWWSLIVALAFLVLAHLLLTPPKRPAYSSKTAEWACFFRYVAWLDNSEKLHINDPFAAFFVRPSYRVLARLMWPSLRRKYIEKISHYALGWVVARTKYYDEAILQRASQFSQFCILGAGFDCRAYRLDLPTSLKIFEVDRPETQQFKVKMCKIHDIHERLDKVTFVPVNFNTDQLEDALPASGFDKNKTTMFLWEAVTQYITAEAVDSVLRFVKDNSAPGSCILFDFKYKEAIDGSKNFEGGVGLKIFVGQANEPYIFGIPQGTTKEFLEQRGFELAESITPTQLSKYVIESESVKYFLPTFQEIAIARVK